MHGNRQSALWTISFIRCGRSHQFLMFGGIKKRFGGNREAVQGATLSESRLLREAESQADIFLRLDGLSIQHGRVVTPLAHGGKRCWKRRRRPAERLKIFDRSIRSDRRV